MFDIKRLKELATQATGGPWMLSPALEMRIVKGHNTVCSFSYHSSATGRQHECYNAINNAVFIGSCDPDTILALIEKVEDGEKNVETLLRTGYYSAISWSGYNIFGDDKSVEKVKKFKHAFEQAPVYQEEYRKRLGEKDKEIAELKAVLRMHHNWHQDPETQIMLGDEPYGLADCYVDSTLEEITTKALKGS